jgi:hypothetical protein
LICRAFVKRHLRLHNLHPHLGGTLGEVVQHALAVAFREVVLPLIGVFDALGEQGIDEAGQFVCGSRHRLGFVHA